MVKTRLADEPKSSEKSKVKIPSNLLFKCPRCGNVMFVEDFEALRKVCSACGYHARMDSAQRLAITVDKGSFVEYDAGMVSKNPIAFEGYEQIGRAHV